MDDKLLETEKVSPDRDTKNEKPHNRVCIRVHKVSPYFNAPILEQELMKIKTPKPCERDGLAVKNVSPYFQKVPKEEEEAVHSNSTDNNDVQKESSKKKKRSVRKTILLTASQKRSEAYQRKTPDKTWKPPRSELGLLQEDHAHDPWRVLVICMLLNCTTGKQVWSWSFTLVLYKL